MAKNSEKATELTNHEFIGASDVVYDGDYVVVTLPPMSGLKRFLIAYQVVGVQRCYRIHVVRANAGLVVMGTQAFNQALTTGMVVDVATHGSDPIAIYNMNSAESCIVRYKCLWAIR